MGQLLAPGEGGMTETRDDHPVAVAALARKRGEIAGIIAELEKQLAAHRADLMHIDNALRLMNSPIAGEAIPARKPRVRNAGYFVHGELSRRIYEGLRDRETVSAAELADIAMRDKSLPEDKGVRATFVSRFLVRLDQMALRGHVERIKDGQAVRWKLVRDSSAPPVL
jgi:hypothetical protein